MDHHRESEQLVETAISVLMDQFDLDRDSFFLVVTKEGKEATKAFGDQTVIGELSIRSVVPFINQVVSSLCEMLAINPHIFINRYIVGHFVDHDRTNFTGSMYVPPERMEELLDDPIEADPEPQEEEDSYVYNDRMTDIEN